MATLPRRDSEDLASLVGEAAARPDAGREALVTTALRSLPQAARPAPRFSADLRARLVQQAREAVRDDGSVPTAARPD